MSDKGGRAQLLGRLFEQSLLGIAFTDLDGAFMETNEAFRRFIGYSEQELLQRTIRDVTSPSDWAAESDRYESGARASGNPLNYFAEKRFIRKDGATVWGCVNATFILDANGNPAFAIGMVEDITDRKQTEQALQESEQRYRELFISMASGFSLNEVILDAGGKPCDYLLVDVNPAFERLTGLRRENILGRRVTEVIPTLEPAWIERFGTVATTGEPVHFEDHVAGLGRYYDVFSYCPKPGFFAVTFTDITKRKLAEALLAEEKERLTVTLRSIADAVVATDREGRVTLLNRNAETFTGWSQAEARGEPVTKVLQLLDADTRQSCGHLLDGIIGASALLELPAPLILESRDGTDRYITGTAAPIYDCSSNPIGMVMAVHDATEKKRLQEEQFKTEKLESLGALAGGIAHDFNNLLTTILGNVALARSDSLTLRERDDLLKDAETSALTAKDLTHQLLTFARGGKPVKQTLTIKELLKEAAAFALRGSSCQVEFHIPDSLEPAEGDPGQLSQLIRNLVINAEQAMPNGGMITLSAGIVEVTPASLISLPEGHYLKISVRDRGVGIPQHLQEKIFNPYFSTKPAGSGLGLATSLSIARSHGGALLVDSTVGIGSTFHLYLPCRPVAQRSPAPPPVMTAPRQRPASILILDDEESIRHLASRILARAGFAVQAVATGQDAVASFLRARGEGQPFDAVLLDLTIRGGMGGKDTLQQILKVDPSVKAIVSSGYSNDPIMADYARYGFLGIVPKPYQPDQLVKTVESILELRAT